MNRKEAVITALFIVAAWWVYNTYRDNQQLKVNNTALSAQLTINTTTLSAVAIRHRAALGNIKAKQTGGTAHVKVKTVIKTVFKDSECAVTPVPADAVSELRRYPDGIRTHTGNAVELLAYAMKYIANCNHDKRAIREIEFQKHKTFPGNGTD